MGRTFSVTTLPGFMSTRTQEQTRRPRLLTQSAPCLRSLAQPDSTQKVLGYTLKEDIGQRPEGDGRRNEDRSRGYERNGPASESSRTDSQIENLSTSKFSEAEIDIINV